MTEAGIPPDVARGRRDSGFGIRIKDAGDAAVLLELEAIIDPQVNARAVAIAAFVRSRQIEGVRDVVPTFRSVAVHFDPLLTDVEAVRAALRDGDATPAADAAGTLVEVPVAYGGEDGPDLRDVASFAGASEQAVIDRHTAREYRVFMLGFMPGFAYMGTVDDSIAAPRRSTPRTKVPAGSVGIAGKQTGIYPRVSPGGWQVIGRTALRVFDANRTPPALFAPGDRVRFVAVSGTRDSGFGIRTAEALHVEPRTPNPGSRQITILRPGLLTTIQDPGRWGHQDRGVPVAGPMDAVSHRLANALVGNDPRAAALEVTLLGPEIRIEAPTTVAVAGADLSATIDGAPMPINTPRHCAAGTTLRFGPRSAGARAYVAFDGGIDVPLSLGSRATHLVSGLGGIDGRALKAGDCLALSASRLARSSTPWRTPSWRAQEPSAGARLRVLPGPQHDQFDDHALDALQQTRFIISPQSDRMGYRLIGGSEKPAPPIAWRPGPFAPGEMISDATFIGGIQVPPSGDPILLMADRQTTGGYPQIATVISADLPKAGQLAPGEWIEFAVCTRADAILALREQDEALRGI